MARSFLILALLIVGCEDDGVITDLTTSLPDGDRDAEQRLARLEIEVWPPELEACRTLIGWRRSVCGRACSDPPSPRDIGQTPDAEISVDRLADGSYSAQELRVPGSGPWEVVVRGIDDTGNAFLHGCKTVASGEGADVALFRPWCDTAACAGQFHPACPVEIDCAADPGDDPDGIGPPSCRPLIPVLFAWEEDGQSCDPDGSPRFAPCQQARVVCEDGLVEPQFDGQCPDTGDPMCGGSVADDLDCDGRFPGPCGSCTAGAMMTCGIGACAAVATCESDGTWGDCVIPAGASESCGGGDEDCDGLSDSVDEDAFTACNAGRDMGAPAADACDATQGCLCGSSPACTGSNACCGGACVDTETSTSHCGRCGLACAVGIECVGGECMGAECNLPACNDGRPDRAPAADGCGPSGSCQCGAGPACAAGRACCDGVCRLGNCELPVDAGVDACEATTEMCGGGDQDCDGVPDAEDPDALDECNFERTEERPSASQCTGEECRCGDEPACEGAGACCMTMTGLSCVNTMESETDCGSCGNICEGGETCVVGVCTL